MWDSAVRSILYFSCLKVNEESADKFARLPMDMMLLDLEDAVPAQERVDARSNLLKHFLPLRRKLKHIALRVNSVHTSDGLKDLLFLSEHGLDFDMILVPMVEDPHEMALVRKIMNEHRLNPALFALIETPRGVENVHNIAGACDGLFYGGADYCASIGIDVSKDTTLIDYATSRIVNAAAMHGIPAYDTPCFKMNDLLYLEKESDTAFRQGFHGKQAIHPEQLGVINQSFTQPALRLQWARQVIDATRQVRCTISKIDNTMVGPPFAKLAGKILAGVREDTLQFAKQ